MRINVYSIEKTQEKEILSIIKNYQKMIAAFAKIEDRTLFGKKVSIAQNKKDEKEAKRSYANLLEPHLGRYNVALHPAGKQIDSFEFSEIFKYNSEINFFIGGAYGFDEEFLKKNQKVFSLSRLTLSHKIAKVVLFEQIFRGLCIVNGHPYHK